MQSAGNLLFEGKYDAGFDSHVAKGCSWLNCAKLDIYNPSCKRAAFYPAWMLIFFMVEMNLQGLGKKTRFGTIESKFRLLNTSVVEINIIQFILLVLKVLHLGKREQLFKLFYIIFLDCPSNMSAKLTAVLSMLEQRSKLKEL